MLTRRYNQAEVDTILRRAADLQGQANEGASLAEIEKIASEAGISTALVQRAARELSERAPIRARRSVVFGGPTRTSVVRTVDAAWPVDRFDELLPVLRQLGEGAGDAAVVGRTLTFTTKAKGGKVTAEVTVLDGRTTLQVESDLREYATNAHVPLLSGLVLPTLLIVGLTLGPVYAAIATSVLTLALLALGRALVDRRAAEQAAVVERIGDTLARGIGTGNEETAPRRSRSLVKFSQNIKAAPWRGRPIPHHPASHQSDLAAGR